MDVCDQAQEFEERFIANGIREATIGGYDRPLYRTGVRCCVDCEMPIPKKRLAVKPDSVRCIKCQASHEKEMQ